MIILLYNPSPNQSHTLSRDTPDPLTSHTKRITLCQNSRLTPTQSNRKQQVFTLQKQPPHRHYPVSISLPFISVRVAEFAETFKPTTMAATIEDPDVAHPDRPDPDNTLLRNSRYCFCLPCFGPRRLSAAGLGWREWIRNAESENRWWTKGFTAVMKVREWSEIVAGPKWKTFIRRFNRSRSGSSAGRNGKFQYDPLSYALNFDEGQNGNFDEEDEHDRFRDFSTRFASGSALPTKDSPVYS